MDNNWSQNTTTISDGIELFFTRTGNGDKPALLMAHGFSDQGDCWHQLAGELESDYDIIMYDAYGHGKSSRIDPEKRLDMVEDMHEIILALELEKPGIIGHSMGAATAAGFAAKYPELLSCLVLEDPPWSDEVIPEAEQEKGMKDWKAYHLKTQEKSLSELIAWQKKTSPNWEEAIIPQWAEAKLAMDITIFDHFELPAENWREITQAIQVPTLIIAGDNDKGAIVTPALGIAAMEQLAHGEFGHISNAGHCVRYEQFQAYLTMVKLFLKQNLPG